MANFDIATNSRLGATIGAQYVPWDNRLKPETFTLSYGRYNAYSRDRKAGFSSGFASGWRPMTLYNRGSCQTSWKGYIWRIQGPYSGSALVSGYADCQLANPADYTTYWGPLCSGASAILDSNLASRVTTEMLLKLGDRDVNIGNAIGEGRETLSMIASRVLQLWEAYRHLRRGDLYRTMKSLGMTKPRRKNLSPDKLWLETWFGWVPLFQDIYGGVDAFKLGLKKPQVVRVVRKLSTSSTNSKNGWTAKTSQSIKGTSYWRISDPSIATLSALGLLNPVAVAWELVPYSFVVDWLFPVGNVLQAATADLGMVYLDGCLSAHTEVETSSVYKHSSYPNGQLIGKGTAKVYSRTPWVAPPRPSFYWKSPFSTKHIAHAAALTLSKGRG